MYTDGNRLRASCICFSTFFQVLTWCLKYSHATIYSLWKYIFESYHVPNIEWNEEEGKDLSFNHLFNYRSVTLRSKRWQIAEKKLQPIALIDTQCTQAFFKYSTKGTLQTIGNQAKQFIKKIQHAPRMLWSSWPPLPGHKAMGQFKGCRDRTEYTIQHAMSYQ